MDVATRQRLIRLARTIFAIATVVAVVFVVRDDVGQLTDVSFSLTAPPVALALAVAVLGTAQLPLAFRGLLMAQGQRRLTVREARRMWWRSQVARFLPTGVAGIAARVVLAGDLGLSRRAASAAMGQEIAQLLGWSTLVGGVTVATTGIAPRWMGVAAAAAAAVGLVSLPLVLRTLDRRAGLTTNVPMAWKSAFRYGLVVLLKAGRAGLVAVAMVEVSPEAAVAVAAADAVGQVVGTLSIAPSGLGTREAAFIALVGPVVGVGRALSLAVVLRVLDLGVELGWVAWVSLRSNAAEPLEGRSPRVLHLTSSYPRSLDDHVAPFLLDLVAVQRRAGWDVRVVATHDAGLPRVQELQGVQVHRFRYAPDSLELLAYRGGGHAKLQKPWHVLLLPGLVVAETYALWRGIRRQRPDVVVAHWLAPSGLVAALFAGRSSRVVLTLHGNDVALASTLGPVARWALRRVDGVASISRDLGEEAERVLGLEPGRVAVTRVPLPEDLVPSPMPAGPPRVIAAGRASIEKGFDVLLDALELPEAAGWECTLVVDGPERDVLADKAASLAGRVRVVGALPRRELFALVRDHHAVAVPSRREGLGLFALECLALGRRVIASDVGGLPEVIRDVGDGALVPADDPRALASALQGLDLEPPMDPGAVADHRPAAVLRQMADAYGFPLSTVPVEVGLDEGRDAHTTVRPATSSTNPTDRVPRSE